jgi:UDP-N-acetylmuramate: L-alanyl-gamma-D-glutamyl-meso-diaminopimelate ligase
MTAPNPRTLPELPPLESLQTVHIIGLCGTAMGTLGAMLRERGFTVRGTDAMAYPPMSTWLEARGMTITSGYAAEHIAPDTQLVVVGNVARRDNPEVLEAQRRKLPMLSLPEVLRTVFLAGRNPLVVTGTHGKTTTTAMTATILHQANRDPSLFVGGVTANFDSSYLLGSGREFVVEGDEYDTAFFDKVPKFWHYPAFAATINNIEFDHADIYADLGEIEGVFTKFAEQVDPRGELWVNGDDALAMKCSADTWAKRSTFGLGPKNHLRAEILDISSEGIRVALTLRGKPSGEALLPVVGTHNVRNFLGAAGLCLTAGLTMTQIIEGIAHFRGVKRRQELVGRADDISIYDDFAHHPTAVRETLAAIHTRHPEARLIVAFEAKSNTSRRAVFQSEYPPAFEFASLVFVSAPWRKDNLPESELLDIPKLVADMASDRRTAELIPEVDAIVERLLGELRSGDVFVALSGSAFGDLPRKVLAALQARAR